MELRQRTILITGDTSGIGLALAQQLLEGGNIVLVTGRDQARLDATGRALPGVHLFRSDAGDEEAIATLHGEVLARFPALDTLVNNAGTIRNLRLAEPGGVEDVTREITTNLSGPVQLVQRFLPHLLDRRDALIVNVSSGLAFLPFPAAPISAPPRRRCTRTRNRCASSSRARGSPWSSSPRPARRRRCSDASSPPR